VTTANKTTAWAFTTRTTTLATNTTLGTAARHDFTAITIDIPELTRTIRSVKLRVTARDAFTVATDFDGWRLGIKLGAVAFDDADFVSAAANTGDHETLIVERDVTAYFVTNFGSGASQTCQVGVAFQTGVASNVNNITAELWLTYDYDTSASTHVKTVEIPIQGHHTTISTSDVEIGTTGGVSDAPVNQIPDLSTFLPEASKTFKQIYLRVTATDAGNAATNFNLSVKLDAGGTYDARATIEQTLITATPYRDLIDLTASPYSITTNAAHALIMKSSLATTFECVSAVLVVTYTFTPAGTAREIHSIRVPIENERSVFDPSEGITAGDDERYSALLDIEEPGVITMLQSGVVVFDQMLGANGTTTAIYNSAQAVRLYTHASLTRNAPHIYTRRCDHDSSNWTIARGQNRLTIDSRISAAGNSEISGYAIVNYTADIPANGVGTGNRSCAFALASNPVPATAGTIISAEERLPSFPSSPWKLTGGAWVELGIRALISVVSTVLQAERQAGEDSGNGWYAEAITCGNSNELGRRETIRPITRWLRASSFRTRGMSLLTTRRWRVAVATTAANLEWCGTLWTTHHDLSFTVAGVVTSDDEPVANGGAVRIYADDGVDAEFITSTTTGGGTGSFSVEVLDDTRDYFATYDDGAGARGWSGLLTPEADDFDISLGAAAEGPTFPVLATATTAQSIRDRAIAAIGALTPNSLFGTKYRKYLNEGRGDFIAWATEFPAAALRRFQVRESGDVGPEVSNTDYEERKLTLTITVAYPQNARSGPDQALDRDDVIEEDFKQIDFAIGIYGRVNFSPPLYPDAMPTGISKTIVKGDAVDFLVMEEVFTYQRSTS
jgi:hypothetical protein